MKKLILFLISFLLCGCTTYTELSELNVVSSIGIDYYDNLYHVALTTVKKEEQEYTYQNLFATGKKLEEAFDNIKIQENKKIYIAHLDTLILTPGAINQKLEDILNFFLKNTESRNDFSIAISKNLDVFQEDKYQNIKEMIQTIEKDLGTTKEVAFEEFLKNILEDNTTLLPTITKNEENFVVDSATLIQHSKTSFHLTEEECILYNLLNNTIKKANFEDTTIISSRSLTRFQKEKIQISLQLILSEEKEDFSNQLSKKIKEMFEKYKEKKIDIFHFTKKIEIQNNRFYKKHQENLLDQIKLQFNIKINNATNKRIEVKLP